MLKILHDNVVTKHELSVTIPDCNSIPVKGRGSSTLPNGSKIQNVLYVLHFVSFVYYTN
ncbi:hypothetical protein HanPSC8_Chr16g0697591 [Helianthus annuus]|nr:hypothetical protein HanPSC8_Chr16g0697591 [Helianthus annuus]